MSETRLDQAGIDRLVRGVREGKIATGPRSLARAATAERLDFRGDWAGKRIVRQPLPVLELVFGRLIPLLQITLTKSFRFPVRCELARLYLTSFGAWLGRNDVQPGLFGIVRMDPLRGDALIEVESSTVYALVDALMGGLGTASPPGGREVSDIELELVQKVMLDVARDFENAWRPWFPLQVEYARTDRPSSVASSVSSEEVCHVGTLLVSGEQLPTTAIRVVMPHITLEPLVESASARASAELDPNWRDHLERQLREAETEVRAVIGETELPAQQVRELTEGQVIELTRKIHEPVDLLVEDQPTWSGFVGRSGGQYAVRIESRRRTLRKAVDLTAGQRLVRKGLITREQLAVARVDEKLNRKNLLDSISGRGWVERSVLQAALGT